ncbi:uncharacterized protein LAESUDRAFT_498778 [Laetiporus sulphureus 93-53]|uniref:Uncharacterized protein n=1 Tax=Laetiporus sulphureus 93-53 TaxID=1314785 RepID=A0A165BHJ1_9APHY|nr:uncharacterized protein LAESUDRAFT_498778 [Laetiporus sulphureus 93-53]KZT01067.1 hypothetical protein LAESUDRAFT_498778 [Laetiporus sulphureus 93-53]
MYMNEPSLLSRRRPSTVHLNNRDNMAAGPAIVSGPGGSSSSGSSSDSGPSDPSAGSSHYDSNTVTRVVIPVVVSLALSMLVGIVILWLYKSSRYRRRQAIPNPFTASKKPQLWDVRLSPSPTGSLDDARWSHITPLSVKSIPGDVYELERLVSASVHLPEVSRDRPLSVQTSSSTASNILKKPRSKADDGWLRVSVAIAMPSPTSRRLSGKECRGGAGVGERAAPMCLGVADIRKREGV